MKTFRQRTQPVATPACEHFWLRHDRHVAPAADPAARSRLCIPPPANPVPIRRGRQPCRRTGAREHDDGREDAGGHSARPRERWAHLAWAKLIFWRRRRQAETQFARRPWPPPSARISSLPPAPQPSWGVLRGRQGERTAPHREAGARQVLHELRRGEWRGAGRGDKPSAAVARVTRDRMSREPAATVHLRWWSITASTRSGSAARSTCPARRSGPSSAGPWSGRHGGSPF